MIEIDARALPLAPAAARRLIASLRAVRDQGTPPDDCWQSKELRALIAALEAHIERGEPLALAFSRAKRAERLFYTLESVRDEAGGKRSPELRALLGQFRAALAIDREVLPE